MTKITNTEAALNSEENNAVVLSNSHIFAALAEKPNHEFIELTSELIKLEEGHQIDCFICNQFETMSNEEGKEYEVLVLETADGRGLIGDAVAISVAKKFFDKYPNIEKFAARIINKGERTAANGKNKYRDLKILALQS